MTKNTDRNSEANPDQKQHPVQIFRRGAVAVSVWRREHEGEVFYNATPSRAFKRKDAKEEDSFEYSNSFSTDDLPTLAALINIAFHWILAHSQK